MYGGGMIQVRLRSYRSLAVCVLKIKGKYTETIIVAFIKLIFFGLLNPWLMLIKETLFFDITFVAHNNPLYTTLSTLS